MFVGSRGVELDKFLVKLIIFLNLRFSKVQKNYDSITAKTIMCVTRLSVLCLFLKMVFSWASMRWLSIEKNVRQSLSSDFKMIVMKKKRNGRESIFKNNEHTKENYVRWIILSRRVKSSKKHSLSQKNKFWIKKTFPVLHHRLARVSRSNLCRQQDNGISSLTRQSWEKSTFPPNRLPRYLRRTRIKLLQLKSRKRRKEKKSFCSCRS